MVFIVADIFSTTPHAEDHSNVLAALAIQMLFPTVQFRLMAVSESLPPPPSRSRRHSFMPESPRAPLPN
jgi:hypothetical protein